MSPYQFAALILVVIGPVLAVARASNIPPSLLLFGVGLASTALPGLPQLRIDPQLVLNLFLPPLIYASAVRLSRHLLRFVFVPGILIGALTVLATVGIVAVSARFVILPGLSWTAGLLLGVVVSVFDTRIFQEAKGAPHVPRAIADTLKARELVARLVILATFALVLEGASSDRLPVMALLEHYALDLPAGILVGLLIGAGMGLLRQRIDTAPVEIAVSVATPYAAALAAVAFGVSAVGAVTAAALVISAVRIDTRTGAPISSSETRISAVAFWEQASLMVSSALFLLAGRALPEALVTIETWSPWRLGLATVALLSLVLLVQAVFSYVSTWAQPVAEACGQSSRRRAAAAAVMTWSSTRSVIGLVIALAVPTSLTDGATFPERDLILVVAALAIVGSVLLQGFTLRAVVDKAGLGGEQEQTREESEARSAMEAAYASPDQRHANGFDAARQALLQLRKQNRIGDEVMVGMLRETDLKSRAVEEGAAPAGPTKP